MILKRTDCQKQLEMVERDLKSCKELNESFKKELEIGSLTLQGCDQENKRIFEDFERYKSRYPQVSEPESLGRISMKEVYDLLRSVTSTVLLSDEYFDVTNVGEAERFVEETKVASKTWIESGRDCDNFSFALLGYWSRGLQSFSFGMAWNNVHAWNVFIDDQKKVWMVEPQTGKFMSVEESESASSPDGVSYKNIKFIIM